MTSNNFQGSKTCIPADSNKDEEYIEEFNRLTTFADFPSSSPVSASTLARAGFLYTGEGDTVRCFSCHAAVDRWQHGDSAVGRHRKASPNCKFINSFSFENSAAQASNHDIQIGQYKAEQYVGSKNYFALERPSETRADYLLRTGQVVDLSDSIYPKYPAMCSEEARLKTFQNWPDYAQLSPRELASAGLYYTGIGDQVQCFCCGGKLKNWEPCDRAWSEHKRHFPNCLFALGRSMNVQSESVSSDRNLSNLTNSPRNPAMADYEARIISFGSWICPVNKEQLAGAGFYALGKGDKVKCFHCGGGLKDWNLGEDPWEQHAKWYPGCKFLLNEKGQEFINNIHLRHTNEESLVRTAGKPSSLTKRIDNTIFQNPVVQEVIQMGFSFKDIKKVIEKKIETSGSSCYLSLEVLVADLVSAQKENTQDESCQTSLPRGISAEEQLKHLQEEKICKICMDRPVAIAFVPCGHLVTCKECADALSRCPICYTIITFKQKIFMS